IRAFHVTGVQTCALPIFRPNMATMLGFIATDVHIAQDMLEGLVREVADLSFNSITVDGDTSTNDAFVVIATGQAENAEIIDEQRSEERRVGKGSRAWQAL